jgi:hypothetical protein
LKHDLILRGPMLERFQEILRFDACLPKDFLSNEVISRVHENGVAEMETNATRRLLPVK